MDPSSDDLMDRNKPLQKKKGGGFQPKERFIDELSNGLTRRLSFSQIKGKNHSNNKAYLRGMAQRKIIIKDILV